MTTSAHSNRSAGAAGKPNGSRCKDSKARRNVGISGPVHGTFVTNCAVLGLVQQDVATNLVEDWNRSVAKKVADKAAENAKQLAA